MQWKHPSSTCLSPNLKGDPEPEINRGEEGRRREKGEVIPDRGARSYPQMCEIESLPLSLPPSAYSIPFPR